MTSRFGAPAGTGPMADTGSMDDDMIKLVGYTIVSLKPGDEEIVDGGEGTMLVKRRMTPEEFVALVIARYMQSTKDGLVRATMFDPEDLKYLRVHYIVVRRWQPLPRRLQERQIEALEAIRDRLGSRTDHH